MLAVGNDELGDRASKGDLIECKVCGQGHPLRHGTDTKTGQESDLLGFYKCGEKAYLAALSGRLLPGERLARVKEEQ